LASEFVPFVVSGVLVLTVLIALFSRKVSVSLIALFYSSIMVGVIFTIYGDTLVGLLTMVTFAGAVSVLLLTVILMTGESKLDIGAGKTSLGLMALTLAVAIASVYSLTSGLPGSLGGNYSDVSQDMMSFIWQYNPWDLLILVMVFGSAMLGVTNLLSRES
jgi:NADH:ubiquinone oxidoreductase subunit 6 (subunit J)